MPEFDIKSAHRMVKEQQALGNDVEWDNYTINFYRPADHAIHSVDGVFRNGKWAFKNSVEVNSEGIWSVDPRNIRHIRRPRTGRR
jgi:hypothetical protein